MVKYRLHEEGLSESDDRFRQLAENVDQIFWLATWDLEEMLYVSPAYERLTGRTCESLYDSPRSWMEAIHPDDRERVLGEIEYRTRLRAGGASFGPTDMEYRLVHRDGSIHWVRAHTFPVTNDEGREYRLAGVVEDITARKRLEILEQGRNRVLERLSAGESLEEVLTLLVETVEEAKPELLGSALLLDPATKRLRHGAGPSLPDFYNEAIDGTEIGEGVGSCGTAAFTGRRVIVDDLLEHEYWAAYREVAERAGLRACWSEPIVARSGEVLGTFALYYRQPREPDDEDLHIIQDAAHVARIAIERKRAEDALRESEQRWRTLVELMQDGLLSRDMSGRITYVNRALCGILGYEPRELVGKPTSILVHESGRSDVERTHAGRQDSDRFSFEAILKHKDGHPVPALLAAAPLMHEQGEVRERFAVVTDITKLKQTEAALRSARDRLEVRVSERTAELESANQRLRDEITERRRAEEALLSKQVRLEQLVTANDYERKLISLEIHDGVAQDLAGAVMHLEAAQLENSGLSDDAKRACAEAFRLLRTAHGEARRLMDGLRPPILDEEGLVPALKFLIEHQRRGGGPDIEFTPVVAFERLSPVLEGALYRITQEALANAVQHSGSDRVEIQLRQVRERIHLEIRDWGCGFDVSSAPENRFGLKGIRDRTEAVHGRMRIESSPGKGTRVFVDVPRLDTLQREAAQRKEAERVLQGIAEGTRADVGEKFFPSLAESMARTLGVDHAFVVEHLDDPPTRARVIAGYSDGKSVAGIEYELAGTPCEGPARGEKTYFPDDLQRRFPEDRSLGRMHAESYCGLPLVGSSGRTIGHLSVIDSEAMEVNLSEMPALKIFASRAAAELERQRVVRESGERFRGAFESAPIGMVLIDRDGHVLKVNRAMCELLDYAESELTNKTVIEITHPDDVPPSHEFLAQVFAGGDLNAPPKKRLLARDGHVVSVHVSTGLVHDTAGRPKYLVGMVQPEDS